MEKLKAKHDHKLTNILKVFIFAIFLLMPLMVWLPTCFYYGVNEHAETPTTQIEQTRKVRMSQLIALPENITTNNNYTTYTYDTNNKTINLTVNQTGQVWQNGLRTSNISPTVNHIYLCTFSTTYTGLLQSEYKDGNRQDITNVGYERYIRFTRQTEGTMGLIGLATGTTGNFDITNLNLFDLTFMYGSGNEPTYAEFRETFTESYYEYGNDYELEIGTGVFDTYTDITKNINYAWKSTWEQPIFNWTNESVLKQGLDNFTGVFGVTDTSYFTNLIVYELIMVAIYVVIDIVITLFTWLTHLIGEK